MFTIKETDGKARNGVMHLPHGDVQTPAFMPVGTNGAVKAISHKGIEEIGPNLILGNTYHLYLRPGIEIIKKAGSLHKFANWNHNILTDSGGFQVFSLAPFRKIKEEGVRFRSHIDGAYHELSPEKVVDIQTIFRSDIMMPLDVCTAPGIDYRQALEASDRTTRWAARSMAQRKEAPDDYLGKLFLIIQGNFYEDLRRKSTDEILELDSPGVAIGGLSVGEPFEEFLKHLEMTASYLPSEKPHYLMGIGTPEYIFAAVENGIDIFDCVYPTRIARNGTVFTRNGIIALKRKEYETDFTPIDPGCTCHACQTYSKSYLRHLFKAKEILGPMMTTIHNLHFLHQMMIEIRQSIREGHFHSFKESFFRQYGQK
ncbi:tRNA guanosine(34) transglycosylase Tgt [Spirochaeta cellobiosiphila]|uniref:tRNA guanosine(34) transglycosylase Tgt n=1 Tax=Spirochaeta cellobiosiphila TaxID=504483 RepID=UPI0004056FFE|nr:tRNA guanosine(34) transglycosylase Tgt [Spirochaeta cellobiosiphila]